MAVGFVILECDRARWLQPRKQRLVTALVLTHSPPVGRAEQGVDEFRAGLASAVPGAGLLLTADDRQHSGSAEAEVVPTAASAKAAFVPAIPPRCLCRLQLVWGTHPGRA